MWVLSVAVPRPLHQLFTYELPEEWVEQVRLGTWLEVPFSNGKTDAFVVERPKRLEDGEKLAGFDRSKLKRVKALGDPELALPERVLELAKWASDYYFAPLGEVIQSAYPTSALKKTPKRVAKAKKNEKPIKLREFDLSSEQSVAFEEIIREKERPSLLQGVTGSGKTEVYIELAKRTLAESRGVIFLVPEIALTPQLLQRIESSLGERVALWHSAVAQGKRRSDWLKLKSGELRVVVGARSGIFAPVKDLGLIVVDEEHDPSFKQEDRVRYHARDLALVRGKIEGAKVVLGSATPSLESLERVREGKYSLSKIHSRFQKGSELPEVEVVDLAEEEKITGIQSFLAEKTLREIQATLDRGEQAIVFLNRRGFAAFLACQSCGEAVECPNCSVSLTVHKRTRQMRCHLCDHRESIPDQCPGCQSLEMLAIGAGTESLEIELPKLLRGARTARLDRDQVTSASRLEEVLSRFRSGEANLLLGTQMLVKGHDFPNVTLVVVMLADSLFHWPDFRAGERSYQILTQVSGRAGRGSKRGRVLVQTFVPDHPVIRAILGKLDEKGFIESEREARFALGYPPFSRLARLRFDGASRTEVMQAAQAVAILLREQNPVEDLTVLGPSEAAVEKVKNRYRWELLLKGKHIRALRQGILRAAGFGRERGFSFSVDLDPQGA